MDARASGDDDDRVTTNSGSSAILGYMHGTSAREQDRLSRLNLSLNELSIAELALAGGEHVLDFGCGLGQLTRLIARGAGRVIGFDSSEAQLEKARTLAAAEGDANRVEWRRGDVVAPPLEPGETFDVAHARFVLEHVVDPLIVVRQMALAVRSGGRIVVMDDDHAALRLWPESPGFASLWESYILVAARNQNDPYVGRRLPALLHAAGARPTRITQLFYGGVGRTEGLRVVVENVIGLFEGVLEPLLLVASMERADYDRAIAAFRLWADRPDAAFWYAFHWAEGVKEA